MASYPVSLMSSFYGPNTNNGESSRHPQLKLKSEMGSPSPKIKLESLDYATCHTISGPAHIKVTDNRPLPHIWSSGVNVIVKEEPGLKTPFLKNESLESARRANGLLLKAQADKVPHIHYPFNGNTSNTTAAATLIAATKKAHSSQPHTPNRVSKPVAAAAVAATHHNRLAHLRITTRIFHCGSIPPRAPGDPRPLIKFYSKRVLNRRRAPRFYRRVFLAGPPEKTEAGDKRIFYRREFL